MLISKITLKKFKKIIDVTINTSEINVLVGENNAGKSSVLQGIHYSVMTAVAARESKLTTFPKNNVMYCPAHEFNDLCQGTWYENREIGRRGELKLFSVVDDIETDYSIEIYRGRNADNIGCNRSGNQELGSNVTNPKNLFSIYVPGLAGVPVFEEFRSERVVRQGVARGDANLYLRNVLLLLKSKSLLDTFNQRLKKIFQDASVEVSFDDEKDAYISVSVVNREGARSLELAGAGFLQAVQVIAYVTLFSPKLLLLDEPDAHLHPNNQALLVNVVKSIVLDSDVQVLISTHSRHMVDSLSGVANFVWLKDGSIVEQSHEIKVLRVLMDIGALDGFDRLRSGDIKVVVLAEDEKSKYISKILDANGFQMDKTLIHPYKGAKNLPSAIALAEFFERYFSCNNIIIHIDNDFMTESEVAKIHDRVTSRGYIPFITENSDIESYFISPAHMARILEISESDAEGWCNELAILHHNELMLKFKDKREDIKYSVYKANERDNAPSSLTLIGADIPLAKEKRLGKFMLAKINGDMHSRLGFTRDLVTYSEALSCQQLRDIAGSEGIGQ